MVKSSSKFKRSLLAGVISALLVSAPAAQAVTPPKTQRAVSYILKAQRVDGGFASTKTGLSSDFETTVWASLGLVSSGVNPRTVPREGYKDDVFTALEYLRNNFTSQKATISTETLARLLIIVRTSGERTSDFAGEDLTKLLLARALDEGKNGFGSQPGAKNASAMATSWAAIALKGQEVGRATAEEAAKFLAQRPGGHEMAENFRASKAYAGAPADGKGGLAPKTRALTLYAIRVAANQQTFENLDRFLESASIYSSSIRDSAQQAKDGGMIAGTGTAAESVASDPVTSAFYLRGSSSETAEAQTNKSRGGLLSNKSNSSGASSLRAYVNAKQGDGDYGGGTATAGKMLFGLGKAQFPLTRLPKSTQYKKLTERQTKSHVAKQVQGIVKAQTPISGSTSGNGSGSGSASSLSGGDWNNFYPSSDDSSSSSTPVTPSSGGYKAPKLPKISQSSEGTIAADSTVSGTLLNPDGTPGTVQGQPGQPLPGTPEALAQAAAASENGKRKIPWTVVGIASGIGLLLLIGGLREFFRFRKQSKQVKV